MAYESDIFLSYRRGGAAEKFVRGVLYPELKDHYEEAGGACRASAPVFIDESLPKGESLKRALSQALDRSVVMLMVWVGNYPASEWCLGEWEAMRRRRSLPGFDLPLVYTISLAGHELLQKEPDPPVYEDYSTHYKLRSHLGNDGENRACRTAIHNMCVELAKRVALVPDWRPDFPKLTLDPRRQPLSNPSSH